MRDDLVQRLRALADLSSVFDPIEQEAADCIEAHIKRIQELEAALALQTLWGDHER